MRYEVPISVLMPVRQGERFLKKAIDSILNQGFGDFELIVIDDGSTDKTGEIILEFNDYRIRSTKVAFSNNYKARNYGMSISKGKYICMMDSDDISHPNRLEEQFNYLEAHKHISVLGTQIGLIDKNGAKISSSIYRLPTGHSEIKVWQLMSIYIPQPTFMFRSHIFRHHNLWYDPSFKYAGDFDYIVRLSQAFKIANLDKRLVKYRKHSSQISAQKSYKQIEFADKVRIKQLTSFGLLTSQEDINLHLKLMKGRWLDDNELVHAEKWLNRLLDANHEIKKYNERHLYRFFEFILDIAVRNNKLGGWAIEKELLNYIVNNFIENSHILEFGSGLGTEALLKNYRVTSIEHDKGYLVKRGIEHIIVHAPIVHGWYDRKSVEEILKKKIDLIIIDGPPGELRKGLIENCDLFAKMSIPIIFDDIDRGLDKSIMVGFCKKVKGYEYKLMKGKSKTFAVCTRKMS